VRETSDTASGAVGKVSARQRNERFSERRGGRGVVKRKKGAIQRAARRARCRQEQVMSDEASGAAGKASSSARNERFSEWRGGQEVDR
jgi:hypothetical protein